MPTLRDLPSGRLFRMTEDELALFGLDTATRRRAAAADAAREQAARKARLARQAAEQADSAGRTALLDGKGMGPAPTGGKGAAGGDGFLDVVRAFQAAL